MIVAMTELGVIGKGGTIPWRYPADMRRFKEMTMGSTVIMGRKTWDSIPDRFRPLPGRQNIILSTTWETNIPHYIWRARSVEEALSMVDKPDVWFIGGSRVYETGLQHAQKIDVTWVPDVLPIDGVSLMALPASGDVALVYGVTLMPPFDQQVFKPGPRIVHPYDERLQLQTFER